MPVYALDDRTPELPAPDRFWIAPDAHVMGAVRLGDDVGIWFGAVLRGDNELIDIGAGTNIQEGAMLHTDMGFPMSIGAGCTIGHHAILHGCTIGENSLVGMGATVLNGARIGRDCVVGAGALVPEGKVFPDRCLLVGAPAKVMRELSDEEAAAFQRGPRSYVERAQQFRTRLKRLA